MWQPQWRRQEQGNSHMARCQLRCMPQSSMHPTVAPKSVPSLGLMLVFFGALCTICSSLYLSLLCLQQPPCSLPVPPIPKKRDLIHKGSFQSRSHCNKDRRAVLSSAALFPALSHCHCSLSLSQASWFMLWSGSGVLLRLSLSQRRCWYKSVLSGACLVTAQPATQEHPTGPRPVSS